MAEEKKPGLLKRIFSFGFGKNKQAEESAEEKAAETAKLEAEQAKAEKAAEKAAQKEAEKEEAARQKAQEAEEKAAQKALEAEKKAADAAAKAAEREEKEAAQKAAKEEKAAAAQAEKEEKIAAQKAAKEARDKAAKEAEQEAENAKVLEAKQAAEKAAAAEQAEIEAAAAQAEEAEELPEPEDEAPEDPDLEEVSDDDLADEDEEFAEGYVAPPPETLEIEESVVTLTARKAKKPEEPEPEPEAERKAGWLARLSKGLSRSSNQLKENISQVFTNKKLDDDTIQDLEDVLIQADLGVETAMKITDTLSAQKFGKEVSEQEVREVMASEIEKILEPVAMDLDLDLDHQPHVILVVGVNGSGKTTTIGKLASKLYDAGFSTTLVAGDTFRAAAIEQLKIWGERTQSPVLSRPLGSDAAGLAFDAWNETREQRRDVMLMDTAGRLQNRTELMAELEKIVRVLKKQDPSAPHTVLLTLDATTGQNALNQVEIFKQIAGVNGLVMTKLDGTARGGILVAISAKHKLPVFFVGVGEQVADLEPFEAREFARSIAGLPREE